jgi:peptide-methionine (S)-S-oxide reductase
MGDHAESVEIDFDPSVISYEDLLVIFWTSHRATGQLWGRQYMSGVWYHTDEQHQMAETVKSRLQREMRLELNTEISPLARFYLAEDYHQKYALRRYDDILIEFQAMYPDLRDFVNSTAVTRVNGFISGYGDFEQLKHEINSYQLSVAAQMKLVKIAEGFLR